MAKLKVENARRKDFVLKILTQIFPEFLFVVWYPLWGCSTKYKCQRSPVKNPGTVVFGGASNGMIFLGDKTLCANIVYCVAWTNVHTLLATTKECILKPLLSHCHFYNLWGLLKAGKPGIKSSETQETKRNVIHDSASLYLLWIKLMFIHALLQNYTTPSMQKYFFSTPHSRTHAFSR